MKQTVLLTRFSALGDVAMTIPVIYSACAAYPAVHFVMLTRPFMTSVFVNAPANLSVIGVDVKRHEYSGVLGLRRLAKEVKADYRIDLYIDLHNVLRTQILGTWLRLEGVPCVRLSKPRSERKTLTREHGKQLRPLRSQIELYADVFAKAGLPLTDTFSGLYDSRRQAPAEKFAAITAPRAEGEHWIGIAPFAAHPQKVYPPEQMEEVVRMLQAEADKGMPLRIFLFGGGAEEQRVLDGWASRYPAVTSLAGKKYGFAAELALLNHLDLLVSMDSGNMHLGAIAGTTVISIWGATHPFCGFLARGQSEDNAIQLPLECRPCSVFGNKPCRRGDLRCLRAIEPAQIFDKVISHLKA
ncbi:MAG: glycosyltransferase family 9 protein [Muribaculaceae bacterium]|nr:glycosyltransferase family 9 protein [Muribaculaceae bacterium]